ncbi:hypothetical protein PoB_003113300 [Plakobranchus ocellatus]|uniref:Uncharacterized protein n=1 Tax=Plakobranchus ocellatus TaxID=259542 RepID=A0AAV4ABJ1_9GAST|nr:hypothetical protein PoB_003113300 [Plakobranchus ocellatus]
MQRGTNPTLLNIKFKKLRVRSRARLGDIWNWMLPSGSEHTSGGVDNNYRGDTGADDNDYGEHNYSKNSKVAQPTTA